jgi:hypothetical protein
MSDHPDRRPEFKITRHRLPILCEHCGEETGLELSDEQAERLARGLLASVAGLDPLQIEVRGEG